MNAVLRGPYGQIVLGSATVTVGRTPDNQLVVNDPKVSSRQAEIRPTVQGYLVTDLGSSYGTFVDGQRLDVNVPRLLMSGNMIRFGDTTFTYEIAGTPVHQAQWSSAENQANFAPFPPPSTTYGAQPEYAPYQPGQPQSYTPPPSPAAYPPYDPTPQQSYDPYTPPLPTYLAPPPPAQQVSSRGPRGGGGRTILLIALAVLVILAGAGLFFVIRTNQIATANATATATAETYATATVASARTATAQANAMATASVIAANANPYLPGEGTLALSDPLSDNSKGLSWDIASGPNGTCAFSGQAYHASTPHTQFFVVCAANATDFSNFVFEVQMKIIKGDCGGLFFRANSTTGQLYYFEVCQDGSYNFSLYMDYNGHGKTLVGSSSPAITTGLNQLNVLAVAAHGSTLDLYVNKQKMTSLSDSTYSHGQIGLIASANNHPTEVVYSNVKVWTL
jgi:eukaryotic-like serine/threonine-protein kinase